MLDNLTLFVAIVEAGSLNKAAKQCNIPAATLTRKLQRLEVQLGCQLLHRSPRGLKLTQEGERYFSRCRPLLANLQQAVHDIHNDVTAPVGTVRMLAPINLAVSTLADFWADFLQQFPMIQLDLQLDNRNDNLFEQGADLALRVGQQHNPNDIQRRLGCVQTSVLASPDYLAKQSPIVHPDHLLDHDWLIAVPLSQFSLTRDNESITITIQRAKMQVNEARLCIELASRGLGLCYAPLSLCQSQLASGKLVRVLPQWQTPIRDIYAVWQGQKPLPARVRVLVEALVTFFQTAEMLQKCTVTVQN